MAERSGLDAPTTVAYDRAMRVAWLLLFTLWLVACGKPTANEPPARPSQSASSCAEPPPPPPAAARPRLLVQDGHSATVNAMALDGDGSLLATAAIDGSLRLWDARSGLLLRRSSAYGAANGVALDRAGTRLAHAHAAIGQKPSAVRVERLADGKTIDLPMAERGLFVLAPDGRTVTVADSHLVVYDLESGSPLRDLPLDGEASALGQDLDGKRVAVGTTGRVRVVEVASGTELWSVGLAGDSDFSRRAYDVALAGDSLLVKRHDATYELVDRRGATGELGRSMAAMTTLLGVWLGGLEGVRPVDLESRRLGEPLPVGEELFRTAMSADGRTLALAYSEPNRGSEVRLMDVASRRVMRTIEAQDTRVFALAVSPTGEQLAVGSQSSVSLWSLSRGEKTFGSPEGRFVANRALVYGPEGRQLVSAEGPMLKVREPRSGHVLRAWKPESVSSLFFRPGSALLLTTHAYGAIMQWDLSQIPASTAGDPSGYEAIEPPPSKRLATLPYWIDAALWSPDGKRLLVEQPKGFDPKAKVPRTPLSMLDATTFDELWSVDDQSLFSRHFAFSPDGTRLVVSTELPQDQDLIKPPLRVLQSYDAATGQRLAQVTTEASGPLAFHGDRLLIGGESPVLVDAETFAVRRPIALRDILQTVVLPHPTLDAFFLGSYSGATALVSGQGDVQALLVETPGGDFVATTPDGAYRSSLDGARRLAWSFSDPLEAFSFEQFASRYERPALVAARLNLRSTEAIAPVTRPPRVELSKPIERTTREPRVALSLHASSPRRVDHVRVYVNGRLSNDALACRPEAELELEVPLRPGRNRLAVIASDADGFASNPLTLDVESKAPGERPDLWVVAVGVSAYPNLPPRYQLRYADDDARSIADVLASLAGAGKPFARAHLRTLTDEQASVRETEAALAGLATMRAEDLAVVFLAGHGVRLADGMMRFLTHGSSLHEAEIEKEGIGWQRLERALGVAPGRVLLLLDACHSGHVTTEPVAANEALAKALAAESRTGVLVFAASRGSELSYEVGSRAGGSRALELVWDGAPPSSMSDLAQQHGLFTAALLEAFSGRAPDRDASGAIELSEVIDYVRERVRFASKGQQTPWVARRELFGDFTVRPAP